MKKIIKNLIYISIAFLISLIIFGTILDGYSKGLLTNQIIIDVENQDKIFLLGTSYVAVLNSTHIESRLDDNGFKKSVYNLETSRIFETLDDIEQIISHKPELIVYGVGFRDIGFMENISCSYNEIPSYVPNRNYQEINSNSKENLDNFIIIDKIISETFSQNPKHMTVNILYSLFGETKKKFIDDSDVIDNRLALNILKPNTITPISSLNKIVAGNYCMDFETRNNELDNLDRIFGILKQNQIDVIVYIPPYTNGYLETLSPILQKELTNNIKSISEKHNFPLVDLSSKWEYSNIFSDRTHVAKNPDSIVYSEEIASIIISKMSKNLSQ